MERDGRLHSLRSRSPTPPPYHPSAISLVLRHVKRTWCDDGTLLLLFRGGGPRAAPWIWTYGTQAKKGSASEKRPKSLGLSGGNAVNQAVMNGLRIRMSLSKPRQTPVDGPS